MAIIKAEGLFNGDRLARCSRDAQLMWTRYFVGSNRYARFEINYRKVLGRCFPMFPDPPTEKEFKGHIKEYRDHFLLFVYQAADGTVWGEWDVPSEYKERHPTSECRRSPEPPAKEFKAWKKEYEEIKGVATIDVTALLSTSAKSLRETCAKSAPITVIPARETENPALGIGTGIGTGSGNGEEPIASRPAGVQRIVAFLPICKSEDDYEVTEEFLMEMKNAYPAVDVYFQLNKMRAWLISDPKRRKTKSGIKKFINYWLSKEQDKGGTAYGENKPTGFSGSGQPSRAEQRAERIERTGKEALALLGSSVPTRPLLPDGNRRGTAGDGPKNPLPLPFRKREDGD